MRKAYVQCQCDRCGRMAVVGMGPEGKPGDWRVLSLGGGIRRARPDDRGGAAGRRSAGLALCRGRATTPGGLARG